MGAIWFMIYNTNNKSNQTIGLEFTKGFMNMNKKGPDDSNFQSNTTLAINQYNLYQAQLSLNKKELSEYQQYTILSGYHRLAVNDTSYNGMQPFEDPILCKLQKYPDLRQRVKRSLFCTGEIYNYTQLINDEAFTDKDIQSACDIEVILPLYIKYRDIETVLKKLDGEFTFILQENISTFDLKTMNVFIARDILGIKPLYMVKSNNVDNTFYMFVSELKSIPRFILENSSYGVYEVPPGTYWSFQNSIMQKSQYEFIRYHDWDKYEDISNCTITKAEPNILNTVYENLRYKFKEAVIKRINVSNVNYGFLLSGGFDSSIILSVAIEYLKSINQLIPIHVFTIGKPNSCDIENAEKVVDYLENLYNIDINHHIVYFNDASQLLENINSTISFLETYEPYSIRDGLIYSLLFNYINKHTQIKVLLSGDGLDEQCGYKELINLDDTEFQKKSVSLVKNISQYDLMRADKIAGSYGIELRYPFLDQTLLEYIFTIHPKLKKPQVYHQDKQPIEKYIYRKSFDSNNYLPNEILWRQIEEITDFIEGDFQEYFDKIYSDDEFFNYINSLPYNTVVIPKTKEQMYYKIMYDKYYPKTSHLLEKYWDDIFD
jgi:asparagine synthase (glutamine-hydrolysing)